jgi:MFS family permease
MMREYGWSGTEIGLFQMSGLPVVVKFLLASPIDRFRFRQSNYLMWSALLGGGFICCLVALSLANIESTSFKTLFIIAVCTTLITSWLDVPVNAFAIQRCPENERPKTGAIRSAVTALASVVGGGVMLLVYANLGWVWPFYIFGVMALLGGIFLYTAQGHYPVVKRQGADLALPLSGTPKVSFFVMWKGYFQRSDMLMWNVVLVLYFPFIGAAWLYLKPVMLDLGLSIDSIAWIASGSGVLAALASFCYSFFIARISPYRALFLFSLVNVIALGGMCLTVTMVWSDWRLICAVLGVAIALGLSSGVLFGLIMAYSRPDFSASDYGLQSSLFSFSRILVPISAGIILDKMGYVGMFVWLIVGALVVCVLSFFWMCKKEVANV